MVERLRAAVRSRMVADVPLGAFLSGGVDSSAVVAFMAEASRSAVETCSIGFDEADHDETRYAALVAERFATNHRSRIVAADDFGLIDTLADAFDEPFADASALATYRVSELAREKVKVALSGDGADEAFAGYRRYRMFAAEERVRRLLPGPARPRRSARSAISIPSSTGRRASCAPRPPCRRSARTSGEAYAAAVGVTPRRNPIKPLQRRSSNAALDGHRAEDRYVRGDGRGAGRRRAVARPICRSQDLAARRHPHQGRPDQHGGQPRGARALARPPPGRVRRAAAGADAAARRHAANG